jgi:hypothetical protein
MMLMPVILSLALAAGVYTPKTDFSVRITIYFQGTRPLWTYRLSAEGVSVTRHYIDGRTDETPVKRALTVQEIKRLDKYFAAFPIGELKRDYVDERVDGDSCSRYLVKINGNEKASYACYGRPAELIGLNRVINGLLPRQYRLWLEE